MRGALPPVTRVTGSVSRTRKQPLSASTDVLLCCLVEAFDSCYVVRVFVPPIPVSAERGLEEPRVRGALPPVTLVMVSLSHKQMQSLSASNDVLLCCLAEAFDSCYVVPVSVPPTSLRLTGARVGAKWSTSLMSR